jgi:acetyl esterase/lipase
MTTTIDLEAALDELHSAVLQMLPADLLDLSDIPTARMRIEALMGMMPAPPMPKNVEVSEVHVPGIGADPDVRVKLYRPNGLASGSPALYWIHGGGMVLMSADGDDYQCAMRAALHNCLVVSVDYRLAPESPAPALVNDCYAGLTWLASGAEKLGIDAERIMIGGASAGGGLAAGTALMARDLGGPSLIAQMLVFPMLDHRNTTPSSETILDSRVWNRSANRIAWDAYLGAAEPTAYSSPSIADDLSGLPPAYINVGTFDMFLDEDIAYARALTRAGVAAELCVYPGAFHGSSGFVVDAPVSVRWREDEEAFIARALAGNP